MIVADTNLICYLLVTGDRTSAALKALEKDPIWVAPYLWRSEFCNVLAGFVRKKLLTGQAAQANLEHALLLMRGNEYSLSPRRILDLAFASTCTAYDCEFVALAKELGVKLVTLDKQLLAQFPETAISPDKFVGS
jgi:predicted nucleic acid-binding protein